MKNRLLMSVLMIIMVISCAGCEEKPEVLCARIRDTYSTAEGAQARVTSTVNLGNREIKFELNWIYDKSEGSLVTVLSPDSIADVKCLTKDGALTFAYDGTVLALPDEGLTPKSPLEALPKMLKAWIEGVYTECGYERIGEEVYLALAFESADGEKVRTLFDAESLKPCQSEIYEEDTRVLLCTFDTFELRGKAEE